MTLLHRSWIGFIAIVAALAAAMVAAPTASAGPLNRPDRATASGIHLVDNYPADVVGGAANDLAIRWTAGRALTDGTVRITFPGAQWSTPLRPFGAAMSAHMPPGTFSVRPYWDIPVNPTLVPTPACDAVPPSTPPPFGVENVGGDQVIVISGVTCAPGQSLAVLVEGVQAPATTGQQVTHLDLPITAADATSTRQSVARVRILPPPRIRLQVTVPPQVQAGGVFQVQIQALRPNGRPAVDYRGTVALASSDCTMTPEIDTAAAQFTAGDNGTELVPVRLNLTDNSEAHYLQVYDIAKKAQPGVSDYFDVLGSVPAVDCPVAYD